MAFFSARSAPFYQLLACASLSMYKESSVRILSRYFSHESSISSFPSYLEVGDQNKNLNVEVVDLETWNICSGLSSQSWRKPKAPHTLEEEAGGMVRSEESESDNLDFEDIEDMRNRRNLFYKICRNSLEFEEYSFDFHGKRSSKGKEKGIGEPTGEKSQSEIRKQGRPPSNLWEATSDAYPPLLKNDESASIVKKKTRAPTFNQLTGPYHEPFCLDIYISKGSVRACVVHRVTSKVVTVAHSISKDMKRDLRSRKDYSACVAVGGILAQRAIADDIFNVVYTPRKGEKIEGKLKTVLQSIEGAGLVVKVKIKQKRRKKGVKSEDSKSSTVDGKNCQ